MKTQKLLALLAFACALAFGGPTRADEGEVYVEAFAQPEVAWLSHPLSGEQLPFGQSSSLTFLPRLGVSARYGISNSAHVGIGLDGSAFGLLTARNVEFQNVVGDILTGARLDFALPLSVGWRFDSGFDITGIIEAQAGPYLAGWTRNKLVDPRILGPNGLPVELPAEIGDQWRLGALVRLQALFEARLFDLLAVGVGPTVSASWAGAWALQVGLVVRPSFVFGFGPL